MAEESQVTKIIYDGDGTTKHWPIPFSYLNDEEVSIYLTNSNGELVKVITDFTIDTPNSRVIYPVSAGAIGVALKLTLIRQTDITQENEFDSQSYFNPKEVEKAFDKQTRIIQELDEKISRAVKFPLNTEPTVEETEEYLNTLESLKNQAQVSAEASEVARVASEEFAELAQESSQSAAVSEANTTFYANLFLFEEFIPVTDDNSPITDVDNGSLYLANDSDGSIDFNLPDISTVDENYKIAVIKQSASLNVLNIIPNGADTINLQSSFIASQQGIGCVFFKSSETNWSIRYFAFTESTGINPLPNGGLTGDVLVKQSDADQDVVFESMKFEGFSARFNVAWNTTGLRETLLQILNLTYLGPLIASFTGSSNTLREKGATVAAITLSVNVSKRSNPIARIRFLQGATVVADNNPPAQVGSGVTTANYATPFADNRTFTVEVTDLVVGVDGPTTVSANVTYSFVYPYYSGAAAPGRTAAQVSALTKDIINSNANINRAFTTANGNVYYFAYPATYGNLTSIQDENSFETFSSWTKRVENITGLDGNAVSYNIYESNNPVVAGSTNFTFKR